MNARKTIMILLLLGVATIGFAADRYAVASGDWDATSTWSATSGGAPGASYPIAGDIVYIGEGTGSYVVTVPGYDPPVPFGASQIIMGSSTGNAAAAELIFENVFSKLTVTGNVTIYNSTAAVTRVINVSHGQFTVNGNVHLSMPGAFVEHANSVAKIIIIHGTMTAMDLEFHANVATPQRSQVEFQNIGSLNLYGDLLLPDGGGTLIPDVGTVAFIGSTLQTINGISNITFHHIRVNNPIGVFLTGLVYADGVWTQLNGDVTGTLPTIDGYSSVEYNYIAIAEDDNNIVGFDITMTTPPLYPAYINREWEIEGNYTGNKTYSFYWTSVDDMGHDWTGEIPVAWKDRIEDYVGPSQVITEPKYIDVILPASMGSSIYNIGWTEDPTLPVEFSSFTAVVTAESYVQLNWVTQSESSMLGYYVYRSIDNSVANAQKVSPLISATNTSSTAIYSYTDSEVEPGLLYYWVQSLEMDGTSNYYGSINVTLTGDNPENPSPGIPTYTGIENIFPNPFIPSTKVSYNVEKAANVSIVIVNLKGQKVRTLVAASKEPGVYNAVWDGKDDNGNKISSGIYIVRMTAGEQLSTKKIMMLK